MNLQPLLDRVADYVLVVDELYGHYLDTETGAVQCCPMTTQIKGYPFEVVIAGARRSAALADQIKRLDWRVRQAARKGKVSTAELSEVRAKAQALIGLP